MTATKKTGRVTAKRTPTDAQYQTWIVRCADGSLEVYLGRELCGGDGWTALPEEWTEKVVWDRSESQYA